MIKKLKNKGFTLMELAVIVVLISILVAFGLPSYFSNVEIAKAKEATDFLRHWQAARIIYYAENEHYTSTDNFQDLALDSTLVQVGDNTWTSTFTNFFCFSSPISQGDDTYAAAYCQKKFDPTYYVYATETDMYCCWDDAEQHRSGKICHNIATDEEMTNPPELTENDLTCLKIERD